MVTQALGMLCKSITNAYMTGRGSAPNNLTALATEVLIHVQLLSAKPFRQKNTSADCQQIHGTMCVASAQCFAACSLPHIPHHACGHALTRLQVQLNLPNVRNGPYIDQNMQVVSNKDSSALSSYLLAT
ncbi:hypothetical protein ABBQ32_004328 [Trebouxia sp. C0010 RCD-2024]